ncbi:hypothetical protein [Thermotalea metallivorans]|uniref:CNNM transmembrane domain-containing protein n=1 Tax=Thermotalea metallivorans TaxID=520762 RepID=A0A140L8D4_9FIRM|nr:hypothetical protein [Thermotalea metallivorans]KXG76809.1 hypothetical protein AN619_08010 [Thermotalea metallivorans]
MKIQTKKISHRKNRNFRTGFRLYNIRWVILISVWTFFLAVGMSFVSETILRNVNIFIAFAILIIIVFTGIIFDLIGIAVASARETPFHSMAANKMTGAKFAVKLVRNAGPVANFCNDVIGDICGIISGAASAIIIIKLSTTSTINMSLLSVFLSGIVAAFTVGGKAIAKEIALRKSKEIVFYVGKLLYYIHFRFGVDFLPDRKRNCNPKRKRDE